MTKKFIRKPTEVTAVQYDGTSESIREILEMRNVALREMAIEKCQDHSIMMYTQDGFIGAAGVGDWVVVGDGGMLYVCHPRFFSENYEVLKSAEENTERITSGSITPEEDLEMSIKALRVYPIEPAIIESMLSNLRKIVNNKNKKRVRND